FACELRNGFRLVADQDAFLMRNTRRIQLFDQRLQDLHAAFAMKFIQLGAADVTRDKAGNRQLHVDQEEYDLPVAISFDYMLGGAFDVADVMDGNQYVHHENLLVGKRSCKSHDQPSVGTVAEAACLAASILPTMTTM